jgi:histidyl-tRNA synthetase
MKLRTFVGDNLRILCNDCKQRFQKNPLRALDCKAESCKVVMGKAPSVLEYLDDACRAHFEELQSILTDMGIAFTVNPKIVRGLDYYTRTVFEFMADGFPTVIGGGRYDGLIEEIGGGATPAVGFGMGIERLLLLLKSQEKSPEAKGVPCQVFLGHAGDEGYKKAQAFALALRQEGIAAESDLLKRSVKAQMKYAGKREASFSMIIGDNEIAANSVQIKNMQTGEQRDIPLSAKAVLILLRGKRT